MNEPADVLPVKYKGRLLANVSLRGLTTAQVQKLRSELVGITIPYPQGPRERIEWELRTAIETTAVLYGGT